MSDYRYFDRQGNPLESVTAADWTKDARTVASTEVGDSWVSTVHLVIDHSFGDGPPLIFETMIFGGPLEGVCERYSTEEQAVAGHKAMVRKVLEMEKRDDQ